MHLYTPFLVRLSVRFLRSDVSSAALAVLASAISPPGLCSKENSMIRIRLDCKRLNAGSIASERPLPRIDEALDTLGKEQIYSTFDLISGLSQNVIHSDSVELTVC